MEERKKTASKVEYASILLTGQSYDPDEYISRYERTTRKILINCICDNCADVVDKYLNDVIKSNPPPPPKPKIIHKYGEYSGCLLTNAVKSKYMMN